MQIIFFHKYYEALKYINKIFIELRIYIFKLNKKLLVIPKFVCQLLLIFIQLQKFSIFSK